MKNYQDTDLTLFSNNTITRWINEKANYIEAAESQRISRINESLF